MSEASQSQYDRLLGVLQSAGLDETTARRLLPLNLSVPVLDVDDWVILDESGAEVARVGAPADFLF